MKRILAAVSARQFVMLGSAVLCAPAMAADFSLPFDIDGSYKLTFSYSAAMRMEDQDPNLLNGEPDPLEPRVLPEGQLVGFDRTGLPTASNSDDGNRNFEKYSLINNRASVLAEMSFERDNFAFLLSGNAWYDHVYMRPNDNRNAEFLNRYDEDGESPEQDDTNEFSSAMRSEVGRRARLLDAYLIADFPFGEASFINMRLGQHVVSWGEALFFGGMARDMGVADANASFVPGANVKDILLPSPQVSATLGVGFDLTLKAYYKFVFEENEIFPVGSYFSPSDIIGPGAQFAYGSINPAFADGCPGLLDVGQFNEVLDNLLGPLSDLSGLCNAGGLGGVLLNAPQYILTVRESDIRPSDDGQFGIGLDYRLTMSTSIGFHYLNYHNPNPALQFRTGFAKIGELAGVELTTGLINQAVPVAYSVRYFNDIDLYNVSFSTTLFGQSVAGEVNYRDGINIDVLTLASGVPFPVPRRGKTVQGLVSTISAFNPPVTWLDEVNIVAELQYIRVLDVEALKNPQDGIQPVGNGDELFFIDNDAAGFQLLALPRKRNVFSGWDLGGTISYAELTYGNPAQAGSFGALFGEQDRRLTLGVNMQYLQNLQFGLAYNFFFGDPTETIGQSFQAKNPFTDRDYLALDIKYGF